jgi:hypothetical protein
MRWKGIIRTGIIIFTFFIITIECKTDAIAAQLEKTEGRSSAGNEENKIDKTIKVFLGDFEREELIYTEYIADRHSEETDEAFLTRVLKISPIEQGTYVSGIPKDASIKKIEIDKSLGLITIHMSKNYECTPYGILGEGLMLKSLVNTVSTYYNLHKVIIKIEGRPYSSGHFHFEENEVITIPE